MTSAPADQLENGDFDKLAKARRSVPLADRWKENINLKHAEYVFILCYFFTGLLDCCAFNAWSCFAIMQTGNTIFLGLGASNQPVGNPYGWLKSLIAICCFIIGCFTFSQARRIGLRQRRMLSLSFLVQSICILVAAALIQADIIPHPSNTTRVPSDIGNRLFLELIPLALLAFQGGGQMAASRGLGFNELPTTVLTSVYYDVASDPLLTARHNVKRSRRLLGSVALLIGAIVGGFIFKSDAGLAAALWLAGGLKFAIAVVWCFWKADEENKNN
ncbi:hypothetical protein V1525DRAFT_281329 [Lipomyces kononenkoae]|uniref:Uncharacterized protein n=1 Tax=Lipomyces kononenkoae TaxID=34357 RepID=A0ACC3SUE8_LIPKO